MDNKMQNQKGFTLVEMAIGMVIVSLLISFAAVAFSGLLRRGYEKKTFANMELIADSIAIYTQKHMRVPCPADPTGAGTEPFGAEINSAGGGFGSCDINTAEGIIPFATLGIPQRLARDRFGNWITYRVSLTSALAFGTLTQAQQNTLPINNWCMTRPYWYQDTDNDGVSDTYIAPAKAGFCCGTWNTNASPTAGLPNGVWGDVNILSSFVDGGVRRPLPNLSRATDQPPNAVGANLAEYTTVIANQPPRRDQLINPGLGGTITSTVPPNFPAYVLISHGQNGAGAFSGQSGIRPPLAGMTVPEAENADGDTFFYASDRLASTAPGGANQSLFRPDIDDIVYWQTPAQVMGRIGGTSCGHP